MDQGRQVLAVVRAVLRTERKAFIEYAVAVPLSIAAVRLGESQSLWWYVLAAPLALLVLREIPDSLAERRAKLQERARVKAIANERGHARHARRDDG